MLIATGTRVKFDKPQGREDKRVAQMYGRDEGTVLQQQPDHGYVRVRFDAEHIDNPGYWLHPESMTPI